MALKRQLSLWEIVLAGVGVIVGAGIYALLGKGAAVVGTHVWLSFAVGGFVALMTGLGYAELSARYPKAGAEYVYVKHAFGEKIARLCGFALLFVGITSATAVALGFGGYLHGLTGLPVEGGALLILALCGLVLLLGAKFATDLADGISLIEVLGLVVVIALGWNVLSHGFDIPTIGELPTVFYGTAIVFFAFLGFEELVRMSEETKDAKHQMPKALVASIIISSILYVLVAGAAIGLVGADALGKSTSPLATVVQPRLGSTGFLLMSIAGLLSTFNTVLLIILAASRLLYGIAKEKSAPAYFEKTAHNQPLRALGAILLLSAALLLVQDISIIAQMTDALLFAVFAVINGVVIRLHHQKTPFKGFTVPFRIGKIPLPSVIGLLTSIGLLFFVEPKALLYSAGFFLLLAGILYVLRARNGTPAKSRT